MKFKSRIARWIFPITGLVALIWFLIRVIPKPSRATYPCQRLAFPIASSFVIWVVGIVASITAYKKAGRLLKNRKYITAGILVLTAVIALWLPLGMFGKLSNAAPFVPSDAPNDPIGVGQGINPGRVVWVHDPAAANWDESTGNWWDDANTNQAAVSDMMSKTVQWLTGETSDEDAWDALFKYHNNTRNSSNSGYLAGEKISVKLNLNQGSNNAWPADAGTPSPQAVYALVDQLINKAGIPGADITLYDSSRGFAGPIYNKIRSNPAQDFQNVKFVCNPLYAATGRISAVRDETQPLHFADNTVADNGSTYPPTCVTGAKYMINMALLRGHSLAGITACAKNHFGSMYQPARSGEWSLGWTPKNLHDFIDRANAMGSYNSFVELMGFEHYGGKTMLYLIDGLYGCVNQGARVSKFASFGNDWSSSFFASQDPVAIDSVALDFLRYETTAEADVTGNPDNYLHEAALANNPPSGSFYDPEGDGSRLPSLGAHEHWNNNIDKQYTRNLGGDEGIELISSPPAIVEDIDRTGKVDMSDMAKISTEWLTDICGLSNDWCFGADVTRTGAVGPDDVADIADNWLDERDLDVSGLVSRWKFDESSGTVAYDSKGGNDGTVSSPVWQPSGGVIGGALQFDGNSYVHCGNPGNVFDITKELTVAAWIKMPANCPDWASLVVKDDADAYRLQHRRGGQIRFFIAVDTPDAWLTTGDNTLGHPEMMDGNWHHIAGTYDGSQMILYIDGTPNTNDAFGHDGVASGDIVVTTSELTIGGSAAPQHTNFNGAIDDVRIYDRALAPHEIVYLAGGQGNVPDPIAQNPYGGSNRAIPGQIEAEDYDTGGQGVAYSDTTTGNEGANYRTDDVDIADADGGYTVGWVADGEWMEYGVDVTAGTYDVVLRLGCAFDGRQVLVKLDGSVIATVNVPNTGSWSNFQDVTVNNVTVSGGTDKTLQIEFVEGNTNINWIKFQ